MTRPQRPTLRPAIAYTRVSTKKQGREGKGHEYQSIAIHEFARRTGYEIVNTYSDTESGMGEQSILKRRGVTAAIDFAGRKGWPILVAQLDRFSRNVRSLQIVVEKEKIEIMSCELGEGASYAVIMSRAARAEAEGKSISQHTKEALQERKKQGVALGNPTNLDEAQRKGSAATQAKAHNRMNALAPVVLALHTEGRVTARQIAEGLNLRGEPTARGGNWTAGNVRRLLNHVAELDRVRERQEIEDANNPEWGTW